MRGVLLGVSAIGLAAFATPNTAREAPPVPPPAASLPVPPVVAPRPPDNRAAPVRTPPGWAERPDPKVVADHYPERAARLEIEGEATVDCRIDSAGKLSDCRAAAETPPGYGFGAAAVALATKAFRMKPATLDGVPVDGGRVRIPIAFRLPPPAEVRWPWEAKKPPVPAAKDDKAGGDATASAPTMRAPERDAETKRPGPDLSILTRPSTLIAIAAAIFLALGVLVGALAGFERLRRTDV